VTVTFTTEPVEQTPADERARLTAGAPFGEVFTDHMVTVRWTAERGWHDARLRAHGPLELPKRCARIPGTASWHMATTDRRLSASASG
jgi:hypothetical protein